MPVPRRVRGRMRPALVGVPLVGTRREVDTASGVGRHEAYPYGACGMAILAMSRSRAGCPCHKGHGVPSQTEQGTQREGLGVRGKAPRVEAGAALVPELREMGEDASGVFFSSGAGVAVRRKASRLLSSTNHSTTSPRENSMAWARAEGKLMYHCSLARRLMSWTLVGKPRGRAPFVI